MIQLVIKKNQINKNLNKKTNKNKNTKPFGNFNFDDGDYLPDDYLNDNYYNDPYSVKYNIPKEQYMKYNFEDEYNNLEQQQLEQAIKNSLSQK